MVGYPEVGKSTELESDPKGRLSLHRMDAGIQRIAGLPLAPVVPIATYHDLEAPAIVLACVARHEENDQTASLCPKNRATKHSAKTE
jgi:hypothetical protein